MATFTYTPDFPATETCRPRANVTRFGNYEQRITFGLNPLVESWSISFGDRSSADTQAIIAFFDAEGAGSDAIGRPMDPFQWATPFGETGQFTCEGWSASPESLGLTTIAAEFALTYVQGRTNIAKPAAPSGAFTFCPDYAGRREHRQTNRAVKFGDGYAQRIGMGLNTHTADFQLSFVSRSNTERDQIRAYLRGCAGVTAFSWTDAVTGTTGKYVCREWSTTYNAYNNNTIQATFSQVFE